MMKTDLNIHVYPRAAKANAAGLFPIYVRITLNGKRSEFSTRKFIHPAKWDEKAMRVKGNTEEARTINSYLESIRSKITQMQIHFQFQESEVTIDQFMNLLVGKKTERERTLIPIFEEHNKRVKALLNVDFALGTYERYQTSLKHTQDFIRFRYGKDDSISGNTRFNGSGLWFEGVAHVGNQNSAVEEVEHVAEIIQELAKGDVIYTDTEGKQHTVGIDHIKVIAPYNAQVALLKNELPDRLQVGTVDKFQGQEAPIVIFSLATSSPEDAPRGMEFLYSLNRLNVAVSRAKAIFILVGNPSLFEPDCRSVQQMKLANAFCRYLEMTNSVNFDS